MPRTDKTGPVTLRVEIDPEALKRVVDQGRLLEFVDAFSTLAAGHIKVQLVEELARAGVGLVEAGRGIGIAIGFDVDEPYGTGPRPWPWPGPWPGPWRLREQLRDIVRQEMTDLRNG